MVKDFVVDPMHAVFQNTIRRFFSYLRKGKRSRASISEQFFLKIGENWKKNKLPAEFTREAMDFEQFDTWKATQLRAFLPYGGDLAMEDIVPPSIFFAFRKLSVAIRLLSDEKLVRSYTDTAETCILQFQRTMEQECGEQFTSLAVHKLRHLPADCLRFGDLSCFSCFKYENVLASMKREIENAHKKPLVTLAKKLKVKSVYRSGKYSSQYSEKPKPVHRVPKQETFEGQTWECYYGVQFKVKLDDTDENGHFLPMDTYIN